MRNTFDGALYEKPAGTWWVRWRQADTQRRKKLGRYEAARAFYEAVVTTVAQPKPNPIPDYLASARALAPGRLLRGVYEKPKGSGVWWARWWDKGVEKRKKVGDFFKAKQYYLAMKSGAVDPTQQTRWPLARALDRVLAVGAYASKAFESHTRYFKRRFEGLLLEDLTVPFLREWRKERLSEVKPSTVSHQLALLSRAFAQAKEDGWQGESPTKMIRVKFDNRRLVWLSEEQEAALKAEFASEPETWEFVEFAYLTGLRRSEQLNLLWSDVQGDTIWIRETKTKRRRGVPLCHRALLILKGRRGHERPFEASPGVLHRVLGAAYKRAGLVDYNWHSLRHTFASRLVQGGVTLQTVKELLGHTSIVQTERYAHLAPGAGRQAVEFFDHGGGRIAELQEEVKRLRAQLAHSHGKSFDTEVSSE